MSDTWRGRRRKFGAKKTRDHNARSSWGGKNGGQRLRSLRVDLDDYERRRQGSARAASE